MMVKDARGRCEEGGFRRTQKSGKQMQSHAEEEAKLRGV